MNILRMLLISFLYSKYNNSFMHLREWRIYLNFVSSVHTGVKKVAAESIYPIEMYRRLESEFIRSASPYVMSSRCVNLYRGMQSIYILS